MIAFFILIGASVGMYFSFVYKVFRRTRGMVIKIII